MLLVGYTCGSSPKDDAPVIVVSHRGMLVNASQRVARSTRFLYHGAWYTLARERNRPESLPTA